MRGARVPLGVILALFGSVRAGSLGRSGGHFEKRDFKNSDRARQSWRRGR